MADLMASSLAAHPRSRGENVKNTHCRCLSVGSSPLTRGKLGRRTPVFLVEGLIPAHAGKTHGQCARASIHRAHPRSRGENFSAPASAVLIAGSSPLTRGKHGEGHR